VRAKVEHEYARKGALCYLAACDARRATIFDRCAPKDGIEPFDALIEQCMTIEPYRNAQRVFVILDRRVSEPAMTGLMPYPRFVRTPFHHFYRRDQRPCPSGSRRGNPAAGAGTLSRCDPGASPR
jgi:hypothetical protein